MVERGGCPRRCRAVARVTLCGRGNVRRRLGLRILGQVIAVVAGRTFARRPCVVHGSRRPVGVAAGVTRVALTGCWNVIRRLRQCVKNNVVTVVTDRTVAGGCRSGRAWMIGRGWQKTDSVVVADRTLRRRRNVRRGLSGSGDVVMAAGTIRHGRVMHHRCGGPGCRGPVARVALRRRDHMRRRLDLRVHRQE